VTNSTSASRLKIQGVNRYPMNAAQVSETGSQPRAAPQLTAAGAVITRRPATMPITKARK